MVKLHVEGIFVHLIGRVIYWVRLSYRVLDQSEEHGLSTLKSAKTPRWRESKIGQIKEGANPILSSIMS